VDNDNENDIQKGAKVVLRSGGAEMTVQTRSQNLAYCSWEEDGVVRQGTFTLDTLQLASLAPGDALLRRTPMSAQPSVAALAPPPDTEDPAPPPAGDPPSAG
jgi:uncharacterized protein YodC (DUF2158 family)